MLSAKLRDALDNLLPDHGEDEGYLLHDRFIDGRAMGADNEYVVATDCRDFCFELGIGKMGYRCLFYRQAKFGGDIGGKLFIITTG